MIIRPERARLRAPSLSGIIVIVVARRLLSVETGNGRRTVNRAARAGRNTNGVNYPSQILLYALSLSLSLSLSLKTDEIALRNDPVFPLEIRV